MGEDGEDDKKSYVISIPNHVCTIAGSVNGISAPCFAFLIGDKTCFYNRISLHFKVHKHKLNLQAFFSFRLLSFLLRTDVFYYRKNREYNVILVHV